MVMAAFRRISNHIINALNSLHADTEELELAGSMILLALECIDNLLRILIALLISKNTMGVKIVVLASINDLITLT